MRACECVFGCEASIWCAHVCVYMRIVGLFGDPGFYSCTTAQPTLAFYAFMYECVCMHLCVCVCVHVLVPS